MTRAASLLLLLISAVSIFSCSQYPLDPACCQTTKVYQGQALPNVVIMLPNVITPNGDGINEALEYTATDTSTQQPSAVDIEFILYGKNSKKLYRKDHYTNQFTGLDKDGDPIPDGTYRAKFIIKNGGSITIPLSIIRTSLQDPACSQGCDPIDPVDPLLL
jgi:hypothetical protein